jgi:hypothetical protein
VLHFCGLWLGAVLIHRYQEKNESITRIWDFIFKNDVWIRQVLELQNTCEKGPVPCLVGSGLKNLYYGKPRGANLMLLVNDWTGDIRFLKALFFESLRDYEYDKEITVV